MMKIIDDLTMEKMIGEYKIRNYWIVPAIISLFATIFSVGISLPITILLGYLSVKRSQDGSLCIYVYENNIKNYKEIDKILNESNIDKIKLSNIVKRIESTKFKDYAIKAGLKDYEIQTLIENDFMPYFNSFQKAKEIIKH